MIIHFITFYNHPTILNIMKEMIFMMMIYIFIQKIPFVVISFFQKFYYGKPYFQ